MSSIFLQFTQLLMHEVAILDFEVGINEASLTSEYICIYIFIAHYHYTNTAITPLNVSH